MKMAPLPFLLGIVAAALISVCVWKFLGVPVEMTDAPAGKVHCVSYTPYRGAESPFKPGFRADPARIDADFTQLAKITDCVRIYSVDLGLDAAVPLAAKHGLQVLLGIWIGYSDDFNKAQISKAITVAKETPEAIRAIIVGNEVILRGEQPASRIAEYMREVKAATGLPVTYADVTHFWLTAPAELAEAADFITIHVLPYWTGFPSTGRQRESAVPSIVSQAIYLREFAAYAEAEGFDYNLIEAYDQPWKRAQEGTVGGSWGMFTSDREAKFPWTGPVVEHPQWRLEAGIAMALSFLILTIMAFRGGKPEALGGMGAGFGAGFAGSGLLLQIEHSLVAWRTPSEAAAEIFLFVLSIAVIVFVLPEITKKRAATAPLSFAKTLNFLRHPNRTQLGTALTLGLIQLLVTIAALVVSLGLSFDARYRDFPLAAFALPAVSFALLALNRGDQKRAQDGRREELVVSLLFVICTGMIAMNEGPLNGAAMSWRLINLLFVLPWFGQLKTGFRSLFTRREAVPNT